MTSYGNMTSEEIRQLADVRLLHMHSLYMEHTSEPYSDKSKEEKVYLNRLTALMNHIRLLDIDYDSKLSCLLSQIEELEQPTSIFTTNNSNSI